MKLVLSIHLLLLIEIGVARGPCLPKHFCISSHFVLWQAVS